MNEFEPITASQIDCLVDGELLQVERRAVLISLDHDSDGWRRLALAFLESQALRDSLRQDSKSPVVRQPPVPPRKPIRSLTLATNWQSVLAMAACGLMMFGVGRLSNVSSVSMPGQQLAHPSLESHPTYSSTDPQNDVATSNEQLIAADSRSPIQQQTLRLELGDGNEGPTQTVDVPVVENSGIDPETLLRAPPVISDSVQRALLRSGRRVHEQRQLYEVTLEDGRRGVLPISEVMVENAGWDVYQ